MVGLYAGSQRKLASAVEDSEKLLQSMHAKKSIDTEPLSLRLMRFENINALDLDNEADFKRLETVVWQGWIVCAVWLQVESLNGPRRAEDWQFNVIGEDGSPVQSHIIDDSWPTPKSWPRIEYCGLDDVRHRYIEPNRVYNVRFNIAVAAGQGNISLKARCSDRDSGLALEAKE